MSSHRHIFDKPALVATGSTGSLLVAIVVVALIVTGLVAFDKWPSSPPDTGRGSATLRGQGPTAQPAADGAAVVSGTINPAGGAPAPDFDLLRAGARGPGLGTRQGSAGGAASGSGAGGSAGGPNGCDAGVSCQLGAAVESTGASAGGAVDMAGKTAGEGAGSVSPVAGRSTAKTAAAAAERARRSAAATAAFLRTIPPLTPGAHVLGPPLGH